MIPNYVKGMAFEHWVRDCIPAEDVKVTKFQEHFDVTFSHKDINHILECKCVNYFHNAKNGERHLGSFCLQDPQTRHLHHIKSSMIADNEVTYIFGLMFTYYDIYATVGDLDLVSKLTKRSKCSNRKFIMISRIVRLKSFRHWLAELFDMKPESVIQPEFRLYMNQEYAKYLKR